MNKIARAFVLAAMLGLVTQLAPAQAQPGTDSDSVDQLFNGNGAGNGSESGQTPPADQQAPSQAPPQQPSSGAQTSATPPATGQGSTYGTVRPDDILSDNKLHFFGSLDLFANVGPGWSDLSQLGNFGIRDIGGSMSASLGFEVRPANELRIRGTLSYGLPGSGAQSIPQLSELFADYSILNAVFFRVGMFGYTWGNSQFFQFGNLPGRALPGWTGSSTLPFWEQNNILTTILTTNYPVSLKMSIPMGFNTFSFLVKLDLANYGFANPTVPDPKSAGYGLEYDLVTGPIEWSLAGFYQWKLTPRTLLAMKTSLFGFDFSAETIVAYPVTLNVHGIGSIETAGGGIPVGGTLQRIYPTAVFGVSREWTDLNLKLYAEYAYNGERSPGVSWLADETGPGGHNSAIGARLGNLGQSGLTLNVLWQQNWSDGSGCVAPFVEMSPFALTTIQVGIPFVWGADGSEVAANRLVPGSQRLELLILVRVSGSFRQ